MLRIDSSMCSSQDCSSFLPYDFTKDGRKSYFLDGTVNHGGSEYIMKRSVPLHPNAIGLRDQPMADIATISRPGGSIRAETASRGDGSFEMEERGSGSPNGKSRSNGNGNGNGPKLELPPASPALSRRGTETRFDR